MKKEYHNPARLFSFTSFVNSWKILDKYADGLWLWANERENKRGAK